MTPGRDPGDAPGWWRRAVVYQVYIRSYADADGDGVGDIGGIRSRLPSLRDLGVDAIWITPWYPSPMADGGYDVADYRGVDPLFGVARRRGGARRRGPRPGPLEGGRLPADSAAWCVAAPATGDEGRAPA